MAKPADWKYQSGVCSSWGTVSCCLNVDMLLPLPDDNAGRENMDVCLKVGATRVHTNTHMSRKVSGTDLKSRFVSGGAESVGSPDSEWTLSDRQEKAARGHRADSWTG